MVLMVDDERSIMVIIIPIAMGIPVIMMMLVPLAIMGPQISGSPRQNKESHYTCQHYFRN